MHLQMFWKHIEGFYLKTGSLVVFWVYILFCCFDIKIWIQMLFVLLFFKWHWKNKLWINCTFLLFWDTFFFRITKCAFCFCCKTFFVFWGVVLVTWIYMLSVLLSLLSSWCMSSWLQCTCCNHAVLFLLIKHLTTFGDTVFGSYILCLFFRSCLFLSPKLDLGLLQMRFVFLARWDIFYILNSMDIANAFCFCWKKTLWNTCLVGFFSLFLSSFLFSSCFLFWVFSSFKKNSRLEIQHMLFDLFICFFFVAGLFAFLTCWIYFNF